MALEKSIEPFHAQLRFANTVLDIDLESEWTRHTSTGDWGEEQQIPASDPRPGYTLRWLLKKLQSRENEQTNPRTHHEAWLLLRALLVRTPLAKIARLIKEQKFTSSLQRTFGWLYEQSKPRPGSPVSSKRGSEDYSNASSKTVEGSVEESKASKKRKRDGTESGGTQSPASSSESTRAMFDETHDLRRIYIAVCSVVAQLERLTTDSEQTKGYAVEHLRFASRNLVEEAATMLGHSLYVAGQLLQKSRRGQSPKHRSSTRSIDSTYRACVFASVHLWEKRSSSRSVDKDDNVCILRFQINPLADSVVLANVQVTMHATNSSSIGYLSRIFVSK